MQCVKTKTREMQMVDIVPCNEVFESSLSYIFQSFKLNELKLLFQVFVVWSRGDRGVVSCQPGAALQLRISCRGVRLQLRPSQP